MEPCFGQDPVTHNGLPRDAEDLGGLVDAQSAEVTQLDHLALARVHLSQFFHCFIERNYVLSVSLMQSHRVIEREFARLAGTLVAMARLGMIDQNPAHHLRRHAEKVRPILPVNPSLIYEPDICFMYESRGLQSLSGFLIGHPDDRELAQFSVNQWEQLIGRFRIDRINGAEQLRNVGHGGLYEIPARERV